MDHTKRRMPTNCISTSGVNFGSGLEKDGTDRFERIKLEDNGVDFERIG